MAFDPLFYHVMAARTPLVLLKKERKTGSFGIDSCEINSHLIFVASLPASV